MPLEPRQQSSILSLARALVRAALTGAGVPPVEGDPILREPAGCFVTLHTLRQHALRGCVGRIDASLPLADALATAAREVLRDPRFAGDPVRPDELANLEIEVSVLSAPQPAAHPLDFSPLEHGIILVVGNQVGCFLPQVARETGWTREQLLARLCTEKLGLTALAWQSPQTRLMVFSVEVVGPEPFEPSGSAANWKTTH